MLDVWLAASPAPAPLAIYYHGGGFRGGDKRTLNLDRLWTYTYKAAALRYLNGWIDQLRWQRLEPFQKLAEMLLRHQEGLLNYCQVKVRFGVVEAINGNIRLLIRRGRGYRDKDYLLLKAQRMASLKTEMIVLQKAA